MPNRVFVMGGTSAIAQSLVTLCLDQGIEVIAAGRNLAKLEDIYGGRHGVTVLELDPCNPGEVAASFDQLTERGQAPDGYAHCVGSILVAPLLRTTDAQFEDVLRVNLLSAAYGLKGFIKGAKTLGEPASAVLVSTCATGIGVANHEAIAAAKAGVEGLARSAAATYASDGIRVNVVAPGLTDSPIASAFLKSEVMRTASAKQYPLHGINMPEEVAQAMFWLLSAHAGRVTGTVLNVDGGFRNVRPLVK